MILVTAYFYQLLQGGRNISNLFFDLIQARKYWDSLTLENTISLPLTDIKKVSSENNNKDNNKR